LIHRDEVHGDIRYDRLSEALIDTDQLQRLGRVYQLGLSHLVYRSGTHTRLSHSMGAYLMASRLVTGLQRNYAYGGPPRGAVPCDRFLPLTSSKTLEPVHDEVRRWEVLRYLVGWAALLHDVGHIPVGHTLEDEFDGIYEGHDHFTSPRLRHLWMNPASEIQEVLLDRSLYPEVFAECGIGPEAVRDCVMLICTWKERRGENGMVSFRGRLAAAVEEEDAGISKDLSAALDRIEGTLFHPYMADIVANTISADYLDYLRRDPHNLGLDVLRDERVVSQFWVGRDGAEQLRMALSLEDRRGKRRLDICTSVVELVRQRFRFAEIVYYQKTKVAASTMLAKVFYLLDTPAEIPEPRNAPTLDDAEARVDALMEKSNRSQLRKELGADCLPGALLDPEIGDESLPLFLRERALRQIDDALRREPDRDAALKGMQALVLLDALTRRRLYKTAFTIDAETFGWIQTGRERARSEQPVEDAIEGFIRSLRGDVEERQRVERGMADAAGLPPFSMLVYIPGRGSQAKGIETGALFDGMVVTLESHEHVREEVETLKQKYKKLWRCAVVVHPGYRDDLTALSAALDFFVAEALKPNKRPPFAALRQAAWFPYQEESDREAAVLFCAHDPGERDAKAWDLFEEHKMKFGSVTPRQHAYGSAVAVILERETEGQDGSALDLIDVGPEEVERMILARAGARSVEDEESGGDAEVFGEREAIKRVAKEFLDRQGGSDGGLF
jgi:HD superfamily phosphohydrolase